MKSIYVYLYDQSVLFEVVLLIYFIRTTGNNVFIVSDDEEITTFEGIKVKVDYLTNEINPQDIDLLVITGGDINKIKRIDILNELILSVNNEKKYIGAICAARNILFNLNLLTEKDLRYESIKRKENILISPPYKYVDFAIELGSLVDIYEDIDDYKQTIEFFKFFKNV